jgi:hypothetical protein
MAFAQETMRWCYPPSWSGTETPFTLTFPCMDLSMWKTTIVCQDRLWTRVEMLRGIVLPQGGEGEFLCGGAEVSACRLVSLRRREGQVQGEEEGARAAR